MTLAIASAVLHSSTCIEVVVRLHDTRRGHRRRLVDTYGVGTVAGRGGIRLQLVTSEGGLIIRVLLLRLLLAARASGCRCHDCGCRGRGR